jgi:hypothetical protein
MNTQKHFDLREDLAHSRDLAPREIEAFGYVLSRLEDWRVKHDLPPGRDAACPQKWSEPMLKLAPFGSGPLLVPLLLGYSGRRQQYYKGSGSLLVPLLLGIRAGGSRASAVQGGMPPDFGPSTLRLWTRSPRCRPWSLVDFFNKTCPGVSGNWGRNH